MNSCEVVKAALEFGGPDRIPYALMLEGCPHRLDPTILPSCCASVRMGTWRILRV